MIYLPDNEHSESNYFRGYLATPITLLSCASTAAVSMPAHDHALRDGETGWLTAHKVVTGK